MQSQVVAGHLRDRNLRVNLYDRTRLSQTDQVRTRPACRGVNVAWMCRSSGIGPDSPAVKPVGGDGAGDLPDVRCLHSTLHQVGRFLAHQVLSCSVTAPRAASSPEPSRWAVITQASQRDVLDLEDHVQSTFRNVSKSREILETAVKSPTRMARQKLEDGPHSRNPRGTCRVYGDRPAPL